MSLFALYLAKIYFVISFDEFEVRTIEEHINGEVLLWEEFVVDKKLAELLLVKCPCAMCDSLLFDGMNS